MKIFRPPEAAKNFDPEPLDPQVKFPSDLDPQVKFGSKPQNLQKFGPRLLSVHKNFRAFGRKLLLGGRDRTGTLLGGRGPKFGPGLLSLWPSTKFFGPSARKQGGGHLLGGGSLTWKSPDTSDGTSAAAENRSQSSQFQ